MICVNGENLECRTGITLKEFLADRGFVIARVAVECNGEIISKAVYDRTILKDGDKLEIVNFVGGG